jgi:hypothetical protein
MMILLSESEKQRILEMHRKSVLNEQSNYEMYLDRTAEDPVKAQARLKSFETDAHTVNTILEIGTAFIPLIGPFISAGIGLYDASLYASEGKSTEAGLVGALSLLPVLGPIVKKIPGIKTLGKEGMSKLASKLSSGKEVVLSGVEKQVAESLSKNKSFINNTLKQSSDKLLTIQDDITKYSDKYKSTFGQANYDTLIRQFLADTITGTATIAALANLTPLEQVEKSTPTPNLTSNFKPWEQFFPKGCTFGNCTGGGGTYVYSGGNEFTGTFKGGKKDGQGTYTFTDKSILTPMSSKYGNWVQDIKQGIFYYTNTKGIRFTVRYKDDKLICPKVENLNSLNEIVDKKQADKTSAACGLSVPNTRIQSIQKTLGLKPTGYMNQATIDTLTQKLST